MRYRQKACFGQVHAQPACLLGGDVRANEANRKAVACLPAYRQPSDGEVLAL